MATYQEIRQIFSDDALRNRVEVATVMAAYGLLTKASPTTQEISWASRVLSGPRIEAERMLMAVLAANADLTQTQIQNASDTDLQVAVDDVVPVLVQVA